MSNFGDRMISVETEQKEIKEEVKEDKEENVFVETDKKKKLKEHLAKCREKSAVVRKAKAQEKKANKKSVGRPKKQEVKKTDKDYVAGLEDDEEEEEVFKDQPKQNDVSSTKVDKKPTPQFDIEDLFNKFDERMNKKLEQFKTPPAPTPTPTPTPIPQVNNNQDFMNMFKHQEDMIRNDERKKMNLEKEQLKLKELEKANQRYYGRLPPSNLTPLTEQNEWDKLLNVRKQNNFW